jgi:CyaY protein
MEFAEADYRKKIQETLDRIEAAFEGVDPDLAECEQSHGALTIQFADGSRCILSAQPSVRQLWLALASQGRAYHFNFDPAKGQWIDDKGQGIELLSFLRGYLRDSVGLDLSL